MKTLTIIFSISFLLSCSGSVKNSQKHMQDTLVKHKSDTSTKTQQNDYYSHDTIFHNSRFLIFGSKEMKIDYIPSTEKSFIIKSKGDTLFHDKLVTILGDKKYNSQIYIKYDSKYKFAQFTVDSIYNGELASPDVSIIKDNKYWNSFKRCNYLNTNEWKEHIITECRETGINFAGHFTIVEWGCGCQCKLMAIVDRITGEIFFPDIPEDHIDGYYGSQYHKDSRMIISNSAILEDYKGYYLKYFDCYPEIYEWRDTISKRLE